MNTQNKLVLGLFSLAFVSLGGLQAASQYINYSQSSVLGDQTSYFAQVDGKANFNSCISNSDCASRYCQPSLKRCLPYSISSPAPTKTDLFPLPTTKLQPKPPIQINPDIPCSSAQDLYDRYCNRMYPQSGSFINPKLEEDYISCSQYQNFLSQNCKSIQPSTVPIPVPSINQKCGVNSAYFSECTDQKGYNQVKGDCYDGYAYSYQSDSCLSYEEIMNYANKACISHCSGQPTPPISITIPPRYVTPTLPPIGANCKLTKYVLTDYCPTFTEGQTMAKGARYVCSNGQDNTYSSPDCQSQDTIYKQLISICSQQICAKITPTASSISCGNGMCESKEACEWNKVKNAIGTCENGILTDNSLPTGYSCNQYCQITK